MSNKSTAITIDDVEQDPEAFQPRPPLTVVITTRSGLR